MYASKEKTEVNKTFQPAGVTAPLHCNNYGDLAKRQINLDSGKQMSMQ